VDFYAPGAVKNKCSNNLCSIGVTQCLAQAVVASVSNYNPVTAGIALDLTGPLGPIAPVLARLDPLLANPAIRVSKSSPTKSYRPM
jgi:hypothetical protein